MAIARLDDAEGLTALAEAMTPPSVVGGPIVLLQCGGPSPAAVQMGQQLQQLRRSTLPLVIRDREMAQDERTLNRLAGASGIFVFADDLLLSFLSVFASELSFALRAKAKKGLPIVGVGGGALAIGGLMLANRVCHQAQYELVSGLGWTPRVLVDVDLHGYTAEPTVARATVKSLPGLLGVELGASGAIRVEGSRVESVGSEQVLLLGTDGDGALFTLPLDPGQMASIAPPPFAPFERQLLLPATAHALLREGQHRPLSLVGAPRSVVATPIPLREAPPPTELAALEPPAAEAQAEGRPLCPMCKQIHDPAPPLQLVA